MKKFGADPQPGEGLQQVGSISVFGIKRGKNRAGAFSGEIYANGMHCAWLMGRLVGLEEAQVQRGLLTKLS